MLVLRLILAVELGNALLLLLIKVFFVQVLPLWQFLDLLQLLICNALALVLEQNTPIIASLPLNLLGGLALG